MSEQENKAPKYITSAICYRGTQFSTELNCGNLQLYLGCKDGEIPFKMLDNNSTMLAKYKKVLFSEEPRVATLVFLGVDGKYHFIRPGELLEITAPTGSSIREKINNAMVMCDIDFILTTSIDFDNSYARPTFEISALERSTRYGEVVATCNTLREYTILDEDSFIDERGYINGIIDILNSTINNADTPVRFKLNDVKYDNDSKKHILVLEKKPDEENKLSTLELQREKQKLLLLFAKNLVDKGLIKIIAQKDTFSTLKITLIFNKFINRYYKQTVEIEDTTVLDNGELAKIELPKDRQEPTIEE